MKVKFLEGVLANVSGVAEKPFMYKEGGQEVIVDEPTILIGKGFTEGNVEDYPFAKVSAHERYHATKSPRNVGGWAVPQGTKDAVMDEIEATLYSEMASGEPILGREVDMIKSKAGRLGITGENWEELVRACARNVGYDNSLREWY